MRADRDRAAFIAACRTDVPALIRELRAARVVVDAVRHQQEEEARYRDGFRLPGEIRRAMIVYDAATGAAE